MIGAGRALAAAAVLALLSGCDDAETGPVLVSAIGGAPRLVNPNLEPLDSASAFLLQAVAQGLVRFDAAGEIEPALAERWIVSDDGLRYTFRLARTDWPGGGRITAQQVAARLRAAASAASRNPLKPLLGAIEEIVAMTDEVLEISLKSPRPNFLQLLAQPEMAVLRNGQGSGPFRAEPRPDGSLLLSPPEGGEEEEAGPDASQATSLVLSGARASLAVARFRMEQADLVVGGTLADLPIVRAADAPASVPVFDPVAGLFGLSFASAEGPLAQREVRQALDMALNRAALAAALQVPTLQPRETLLPPGTEGIAPAAPAWAAAALDARRSLAMQLLGRLVPEGRLRLRVALPEGPGYRLLFAHLARDWAAVGVAAQRVGTDDEADLRLVDEVAPIGLASWYLRHFACNASRICDPAADEMLAAARIAPSPGNRRGLLATADRIIADAAPFISLGSPVRWSLISPRLNGVRPNRFARHPADELIRPAP